MELEKAKKIAEELVEMLKPACERIEIAGSIRRRRTEVGDIELLVIPKYEETIDLLDRELGYHMLAQVFDHRRDRRGRITYGPKNKLLLHKPSGIGVDIFSVDEKNWGMALFIRTGPKEWNIKAMSRFRELDMQGHAYGGITAVDGGDIDCPDEETVFRYLQWPYIPPERRL